MTFIRYITSSGEVFINLENVCFVVRSAYNPNVITIRTAQGEDFKVQVSDQFISDLNDECHATYDLTSEVKNDQS